MQNAKGQALIEALLVLIFCVAVFLFSTFVLIQSFNLASVTALLGRLNYCLSSYDNTEKACLTATNIKLKKNCLLCEHINLSFQDKSDRRTYKIKWQNKFAPLFNLGLKNNPEIKNEFEFKK